MTTGGGIKQERHLQQAMKFTSWLGCIAKACRSQVTELGLEDSLKKLVGLGQFGRAIVGDDTS